MKIEELQRHGYQFKFTPKSWSVVLSNTVVASGAVFRNDTAQARREAVEAANVHLVKMRVGAEGIIRPKTINLRTTAQENLVRWMTEAIKRMVINYGGTRYASESIVKRVANARILDQHHSDEMVCIVFPAEKRDRIEHRTRPDEPQDGREPTHSLDEEHHGGT